MEWAGLSRTAWISAVSAVCGLAIYSLLSHPGNAWVALVLVLEAAGLRVVGVVAAVNVLRGLPQNQTSIGAALTDTATEVTSGTGIAISVTILAALFTGAITAAPWSMHQRGARSGGHHIGPGAHRACCGAGWLGILRTQGAGSSQAGAPLASTVGG